MIGWGYFEKDTIGKQLVRASDSVAANIVESQGRFHPKDVVNFLFMSRGSLKEVNFWIRRAFKRLIIKEDDYNNIIEEIDNLAPQLNAFIKIQEKRIKS